MGGVGAPFVRGPSRHEDALPLVMTHGWPASVIELLEVVGPLTDPTAHGGRAEDAFDLVLPSPPGSAFSGEPTEVGWRSEERRVGKESRSRWPPCHHIKHRRIILSLS